MACQGTGHGTYSKDSIKILSASISDKSRNDLNFTTIIVNNTVNISLSSDEAIEEGEGAKFLILFTKNNINDKIPTFYLESRIKGTKDGFVFRDLSNFKTKNNKLSIYILWGIILFFTLFRIIVLAIYKKPIVFRKFEAVFIFALLIITIYLTINFIFYSTNLNWL